MCRQWREPGRRRGAAAAAASSSSSSAAADRDVRHTHLGLPAPTPLLGRPCQWLGDEGWLLSVLLTKELCAFVDLDGGGWAVVVVVVVDGGGFWLLLLFFFFSLVPVPLFNPALGFSLSSLYVGCCCRVALTLTFDAATATHLCACE